MDSTAATTPTDTLDVALVELEDQAREFLELASQVRRLQENGHFRYISKPRRNELLRGLLDQAANVDDAARNAFKMLKKVKRTKTPETVVDALVGAAVHQQHAKIQP